MKILTFIFAVYILLLPCMPCTDKDECNDSIKTAISSSSSHNDGQQHEEEACNPFCSCACCGHILVPNFQSCRVLAVKPADNLKLQYSYDNISLPSDFFGNIWQPPKIG